MKETPWSGHPLIDVILWTWFAFTALAVSYVAYDQIKAGPGQRDSSLAMRTMRWGWVLVTLYTGPFGFIVYWFLHRPPAQNTPEGFPPSLWKESAESTIHCVAGDATGILIAAAFGNWLRLPMGAELIAEYVAGFAVGLFLFQALCTKSADVGSYRRAVRSTLLPETLSMNTVMAGMIPVMIILMSRDMRAMEPTSVRFWGTMSLSFIVSAVITFPVNWWLVTRGLKHGMGGEERARHCHPVSVASKLTAMVLTLAMLAGGIALAGRYGDFSLRADDGMDKGPMSLRPPDGTARQRLMSVSTALPCRISIYAEGGKTILATLKPTTLLAMLNTPHLEEVAQEVEDTIVKIMKEGSGERRQRPRPTIHL